MCETLRRSESSALQYLCILFIYLSNTECWAPGSGKYFPMLAEDLGTSFWSPPKAYARFPWIRGQAY